MYKKIELIAVVPSGGKGSYTAYFYQREMKIVLPIKTKDSQIVHLFRKNNTNHSPCIFDTTKRIICALGAKLVSATIYNYKDGVFYTYLNLYKDQKHYEINVSTIDALNLANKFEVLMYIKTEIVTNQGIRVTKQMLKEALNSDY